MCIYLLPEVRCTHDFFDAELKSLTDRLCLVALPSRGPVSLELSTVVAQPVWPYLLVCLHGCVTFSFWLAPSCEPLLSWCPVRSTSTGVEVTNVYTVV